MELNRIQLEYIDIREFLYKFFSVDSNPAGIISVILQLAFLTWLVYEIYKRFQGTQAERVLRGIISLIPIVLICYLLKLSIITRMIEILSSTMLIGLIVIFAPEFRRVLMQLGAQFTSLDFVVLSESKKEIIRSIDELIETISDLKEKRTGALIALEKAKVERYYVNNGTSINATLSKELLLSIFSIKSPLHDGAVTIRGTTVDAARVILPMTENPKLDWQYGTRHRAAIGFTEVTDSLCIVVSEETGEVAIANQGRLVKHSNMASVKEQIEQFYSSLLQVKDERNRNLTKSFYEFFKKSEEPKAKAKAKSKETSKKETNKENIEAAAKD